MNESIVEAWPLARMWFFAQRAKVLPKDEDLAFCYGVLNKVSRRSVSNACTAFVDAPVEAPPQALSLHC